MRPTADETHGIRKKLLELDKIIADVDFKRSALCRELRDKFSPGVNGDRAFCKWFVDELGYAESRSREMLRRARAFSLVSDVETWNKHKGFRAIDKILDLDRRDQTAVLQDAAVTGRLLETVVRERAATSPDVTPMPVVRTDEDIVLEYLTRCPAEALAKMVLSQPGAPVRVIEAARRLASRSSAKKTAA